jgi:adenosylhomocysteine nucleosidase
MRIAIIAALPGELKPLVRGWERVSSPTRGISIWIKTAGEDEYIAVCGGMGEAAAMRSFAAAEHAGTLDMVLSVGWAGALDSSIEAGRCYIATEVIDVLTGERFSLPDSTPKLRLVTTALVADEAEKSRLRNSYGAHLVDMEAAVIARLGQIRNIPVHCFKAVSDAHDVNLPDLNLFIDDMGQLRLTAFLGYIGVRPQYWGSMIKMGSASSRAARALADAVTNFLEGKDTAQIDRTGAIEQ